MSAPPVTNNPPAPLIKKKGIVKQVLSGDSVIIRGPPKGGPPEEEQINFSNVIAPKLARRKGKGGDDTRDEAYAWEAREFLRKKLVGEAVWYTCERPANSKLSYGTLFLGSDPNSGINITELIVSEGYVNVRRENVRNTPELQRLIELEEAAKSAGKGRYGGNAADHIRNITWAQENPRSVVEHYQGKPVKAIIEHVRDGSTVRAFLLPDFQYITLMISGIRCPGFKLMEDGRPDPNQNVPYAEEARFFVESRLLQRDVEIILESVNNQNFVGSILFPEGNIAEALLKRGFAKCVDWSMAFMKSGADKLHAAEKEAKEKRLRLWVNYRPPTQQFTGKEKEFQGVVTEIFNGDAIGVKASNGVVKKIFFSSIRPPREPGRTVDEEGKLPPRPKNSRPLYDIPWMFESREYLRKKLIGKKVNCILDYISPPRDSFPEKHCYTVMIDKTNVAEALVAQGLATVIRYRQDDDQRSSRYDDLLSAESAALKAIKGVHAKKDVPAHRINDLTVDHSRIKIQYLPSWQRALRTEGIVEFVASGSRFRVFIPKDSCIVTFLLGGISCPRSSRPASNTAPAQEAEPYGDEALAFSKERIMHRDVSIHIETTDKAGAAVIGWLWTEANINLSIALVEEGLATVHFSAEKSEHYRALKTAEDNAKAKKKNIWANYVEEVIVEKDEEPEEKDDGKVVERKVNYEKIIVTEVTNELHFYAQHADHGGKLEALSAKLRSDFQSNPPTTGAYTPKRNDLCAARFTEDNEWYRAKIEKIQGQNVSVIYVDYGNRETLPANRLAHLPPALSSDKPYAQEYVLALAVLPPDEDDKTEACRSFAQDVLNKTLNLNVEFKIASLGYATLSDPATNIDVGKALITDGIIRAERRRDRKLAKLIEEYQAAEAAAKKSRVGIWQYGDITEDDAKEFGAGR